MALSADEVARRYPIHWLVWSNQHEELKKSLESNQFTREEIEAKDSRGRTPLLLAVTLGHIESVAVLIDAGADVNCEKDGWTAVQEATVSGNGELLSLVLSRRDYTRHVLRAAGIPDLLRRLSLAPDFYVEMKWEFTSWVPLVSRMCPFDTYKVYKRGGNVRVDTTLVGFENNRWQRGDRTYIFRGQGRSASLVELDHELGTSWREDIEGGHVREWPAPPQHVIQQRLTSPIAINYLDTDKISFERSKSGIWGWRQDKSESINGYPCKVFSANNVELVSKTRAEHLPRGGRRVLKPPLAGLLALAESDPEADTVSQEDKDDIIPQASSSQEDLSEPVSWQDYFSSEPLERDIGKPKDVTTKVQKFKATLWLCEEYPLEEQIMPILDLMSAISSPHFAKLKDFIQMQLPAGFPVKIEIPLFHVLNARITFGNIFATETPVPHISHISEGSRISCILDEGCFNIGGGYSNTTPRSRLEGDEALLQYAIHQSLMQPGTQLDQVDVWEALRGTRPASPAPSPSLLAHEERQLQRAIEASLATVSLSPDHHHHHHHHHQLQDLELDEDLQAALAISAREQASIDQELLAEQRALDEALRLSLLDK